MESAQHGVLMLSLFVFLQAIGLPVPCAVALILAAAESAKGHLSMVGVLGGSLGAMAAGDALMFLLGRRTGWWLLGALCRVSLNPESCVVTSADTFHRRGRSLLVVAKFLPASTPWRRRSRAACRWAGGHSCGWTWPAAQSISAPTL
ncbi:MAG: hypothetical protein WDM77_18790 [Steroidobacteraceae bacterium]